MTTTDTETSGQLAAQAQELRAQAEQLRAERDAALALAQQEAARLVAEAQQQGSELWRQAAAADSDAKRLEDRFSYLRRAEQLGEEIPAAEQAVLALAQEADSLREQVEALDERLAQLGRERAETDAAALVATEAGDVDEVMAQRARLAALDDVVAALERQRGELQDRLAGIGDGTGRGDLLDALSRLRARQAELRRMQNALYPDSPQAMSDRLAEDLRAGVAAMLTPAAPTNQRTNLVRQ
jgi:chromosome segregation ATPase